MKYFIMYVSFVTDFFVSCGGKKTLGQDDFFVVSAQIQEQPYYNKIHEYITNLNLILLTQKLKEEAKDFDRNVHVFLETLKRTHQRMCGNKDK